jgi:hypothetical protein
VSNYLLIAVKGNLFFFKVDIFFAQFRLSVPIIQEVGHDLEVRSVQKNWKHNFDRCECTELTFSLFLSQ